MGLNYFFVQLDLKFCLEFKQTVFCGSHPPYSSFFRQYEASLTSDQGIYPQKLKVWVSNF